MRALGPLLLLAAACSTAPPAPVRPPGPPPPPPPTPMEGRIIFEPRFQNDQLTEGEMGHLVVRVAHRQPDRLLILQDLHLERRGQPAGGISWQSARPGRLLYEARQDSYLLTEARDASTENVFNTGVLVPREELRFSLPIRALADDWTVRLTYHLLEPKDAAEQGYFSRGSGRFSRVEPAALKARFPERDPSPGRREISTVLLPPSLTRGKPAELRVPLKLTLRPRDFGLAEARRKIEGWPIKEYGYFETAGAWVFRSGHDTLLVDRERITVLPAVGLDVLDFVDGVRGDTLEVEFLKGSWSLFEGEVQLVVRPGETARPRGILKRDKFVSLLQRLATARKDLRFEYRVELAARDGQPVPSITY